MGPRLLKFTMVVTIIAVLGTVFGSCAGIATLKYGADANETVRVVGAAEAADEHSVPDGVPVRLVGELDLDNAVPVTGESVRLHNDKSGEAQGARDTLVVPVRGSRRVAVMVSPQTDLDALAAEGEVLGTFQWDVYLSSFGLTDARFDDDVRILSRVDSRQIAARERDLAKTLLIFAYSIAAFSWVIAIPLLRRLRRRKSDAR